MPSDDSPALAVQRNPPEIGELVQALRPILTAGLPVGSRFADLRLLGLRGVVARSIAMDDRLSRVKALEDLIVKLLAFYPDDVLSEGARIVFGAVPGSRGGTIT